MDQGSYGPEARDIARSILTHLAQDPEATDTVPGITHWWLQGKGSGSVLEEMEHAISLILFKGLLIEIRRRACRRITT